MSNLSFAFQGQDVRFVGSLDKPEWVAVDVLRILYPSMSEGNRRNCLKRVPDKWKNKQKIQTNSGAQLSTTLLEPGLYMLINRSDSPIAVPFQEWLYEEVLPSIRKTGGYALPQPEEAIDLDPEPIAPPPPPALPSQQDRLAFLQSAIEIGDQLGGFDEHQRLLLKDQLMNILIADRPALPSVVEEGDRRVMIPISDRAVSLGYRPDIHQLQKIGIVAANLYKLHRKAAPIKREQFVNGGTRLVNSYTEDDLEIIDAAIRSVMEAQ